MASAATNGKSTETSDNLFVLRNVSADSNANPSGVSNNVRRTGAVPKAKLSAVTTMQNRLTSDDIHVKLNNNVPTAADAATDADLKPVEVNGRVARTEECATQDKCCPKAVKSFGKTTTAVTNGFKSVVAAAAATGIIHNGTCNPLNVFTNRNSGEAGEAGPSGAGRQRGGAQRTKDSESECSSDTGNDDLSCSDECCIYTYKGDMADLPRSFLNLDLPDANDAPDQSRAGSRGSSPEMDFLEMDFDPGPSCDADSGEESSVNSDLKSYDELPECEEFEASAERAVDEATNGASAEAGVEQVAQSSCQLEQPDPVGPPAAAVVVVVAEPSTATAADAPWIPSSVGQRTRRSTVLRETQCHHSASGDLISVPAEPVPAEQTGNSSAAPVLESTMIWSEQEAALRQVTQIGTSACGATAVLNVLLALGHPAPSAERVLACVPTRLRDTSASLVPYLRSRSIAGCTHHELVHGLRQLSGGTVYARFFPTHPERCVRLSQWLGHWMQRGAVPVATLNLQRGVRPGDTVPDAWHHQMLFGVGPHGVHLTNPLERVDEGALWHQLCSESVLLVRREDVVARWHSKTNVRELLAIGDVRWHRLNVLGQVANVVREHQRLVRPQAVSRTHVCIPAAYAAGITLAMNTSNPACEALQHCAELPLLLLRP